MSRRYARAWLLLAPALGAPMAFTMACGSVISLGSAPDDGGAATRDVGATTDAGGGGEAGETGAPFGCVDLPIGRSVRVLTHASKKRTFQVTRAASVDTCAKMPAIFVFHGFNGTTAENGDRRDVIEAAAARASALVIAAEGATDANGISGWSCSGCSSFAANDDVGLVRAIVAELGLDPARLSAVGVDVGGSFVHRLAAELPLAAGAVFGGVLGVGPSDGALTRPVASRPVTMILLHGGEDLVFPFDGGRGARGENVTSFAEAASFWRVASGCSSAPVITTTALSTSQRIACNGIEVRITRWPSAKHQVPDFDPDNPDVALGAIVDRLLAQR